MLYLDEMNYQAVSQQEHRDLLAACEQKDTQMATAILRTHLEDALNQTIHYMKKRS